MESDNLHPVTKMLLARIEEHPEEFLGEPYSEGRWDHIVLRIRNVGLPEDVEALNLAIGKVTMDKIHTDALDELMNGPERRARERAEAAQRANLDAQRAHQLKRHLYAQQAGVTGGVLGGLQGAGVAATPTLQQPTSLQIGSETLTENTLSKIKKALNL